MQTKTRDADCSVASSGSDEHGRAKTPDFHFNSLSCLASLQAWKSTDLLLSPFTSRGSAIEVSTSVSFTSQSFSSLISSSRRKKFLVSAQVSPKRICPMLAVIIKGRITIMNII